MGEATIGWVDNELREVTKPGAVTRTLERPMASQKQQNF